jgi:hypothetical protein
MIKDYATQKTLEGDIIKDMDVESIRQSMRMIYNDVRTLATEAKMSFIR